MTRKIVITGAGAGLGLELTRWYAAQGDTVIGVVRSDAAAAEFTEAAGPDGILVRGDVTDASCAERLRAVLAERAPVLDLLINNAGMSGRGAQLAGINLADVQQSLDVHCLAVLRISQAAIDALLAAERPTIVNVSSRLGSVSRVASGDFDHLGIAYATRISKAAQNMLTACLHREFGPRGLAVYAIHPGRIRTRMASADADLEVPEAAARLAGWIDRTRPDRLVFYGEPDAGEFAW
ncbi:MAG TPA: SDR family NAD(P)-dependent oxidoreductase [Inquilinus sp.]|nr:SDR family NAD(P)-dependent oxidoreductase [Inquilinus sp.]